MNELVDQAIYPRKYSLMNELNESIYLSLHGLLDHQGAYPCFKSSQNIPLKETDMRVNIAKQGAGIRRDIVHVQAYLSYDVAAIQWIKSCDSHK